MAQDTTITEDDIKKLAQRGGMDLGDQQTFWETWQALTGAITDGSVTATDVSVDTSGYSALFSTYAAPSTDGQNIWIGGGGQNAIRLVNAQQGSSNTSLGYQALAANTTGAYNTAVGHDALPVCTTGIDNTAIGQAAMLSLVSGISNTAVGVQALDLCVSGSNNTAVGLNALQQMTSNGGTAVGEEAGMATTAAQGTFLGMEAGRNATTGVANTFLGFRAGDGVTTGANNTIVGANCAGTAAMANTVLIADGAGNIRIRDDAGATQLLGSLKVVGNSGFYNTAPIAKQTGVAVTAAAIHAALVALGLIAA